MAQEKKLHEALEAFGLGPEVLNIKGDYGTGHVNDTYAVKVQKETGPAKYIVQRINTYVFKAPDEMMENIANICQFMAEKLKERGEDTSRGVLEFLQTDDGKYYFIDSLGDAWRSYRFIENSVTYNQAETAEMFGKSGTAFGKFMLLLKDYPAEELHETIKHFHDTVSRYKDFKQAVKDDVKGRKHLVEDEIQFVLDREEPAGTLIRALEKKELPLRVTHNDTKLNNVLFDLETDETLCVIDLDTVMPGLAAYDFGDAIPLVLQRPPKMSDLSRFSSIWTTASLYQSCLGVARRL